MPAMCALKRLSDAVPRVTDKTFARKFVALGRIVTNWKDIVGPDMAAKAQPIKIHYRRAKDKASKPETTLDVAVSSADATLMHYQKDVMLERINRIFGDRWVTDIKFIHLPDNSPLPVRKPTKTLTESQKSHLSHLLEGVDDPEMRESLQRLGQAMLERENS